MVSTDSSPAALFVGPALVVDDGLYNPEDLIGKIVEELDGLHVPLVKYTELPSSEQIRHYRGLSLLVLDWELKAADAPLGVSVGSTGDTFLISFIREVLEQLYCPVFIFSAKSPDSIRTTLIDALNITEAQLAARVYVERKGAIEGNLMPSLESWIRANPIAYTLKIWESGYESAKTSLFQDLQRTSVSWPGVLWQTSETDGVNASAGLADTIARNLSHRFDPIAFERAHLEVDLEEVDPKDLRRILHGQAVLDRKRLYDDVLMPGDFFFEPPRPGRLPPSIWINLTPECDLVPRKGPRDEIRMYLVEASRVPTRDYADADTRDALVNGPDAPTSQKLFFLLPSGEPYIVHFSRWKIETWGAVRDTRQGRLLDPYITLLQQKNSHHVQRQGLPKVPTSIYPVERLNAADA